MVLPVTTSGVCLYSHSVVVRIAIVNAIAVRKLWFVVASKIMLPTMNRVP